MIIADTGFWLALANKNDRYHNKSKEVLSTLSEGLITTWPCLTETCHLLLNRLGHSALMNFIDNYDAGAFEVFDLKSEHSSRIATLMKKYKV